MNDINEGERMNFMNDHQDMQAAETAETEGMTRKVEAIPSQGMQRRRRTARYSEDIQPEQETDHDVQAETESVPEPKPVQRPMPVRPDMGGIPMQNREEGRNVPRPAALRTERNAGVGMRRPVNAPGYMQRVPLGQAGKGRQSPDADPHAAYRRPSAENFADDGSQDQETYREDARQREFGA